MKNKSLYFWIIFTFCLGLFITIGTLILIDKNIWTIAMFPISFILGIPCILGSFAISIVITDFKLNLIIPTNLQIIKYTDSVVLTCKEYTETFFDIKWRNTNKEDIELWEERNFYGKNLEYQFKLKDKKEF